MAKTKSAQKARRVALRRRVFNARRKRIMHGAAKAAARSLALGKQEAAKILPTLQQALDKAAKRGTITKNKAARLKSRFAKRLASLGKK